MPKLCICTIQRPRVGIIFVHRGGVMPMVKDWCGCFDINIMGIFEWLFFMLKWMIIFVLLQVCLGNACAKFVRHFVFSVKWSTNQTWELIFRKTNSETAKQLEYIFLYGKTISPKMILRLEKHFRWTKHNLLLILLKTENNKKSFFNYCSLLKLLFVCLIALFMSH